MTDDKVESMPNRENTSVAHIFNFLKFRVFEVMYNYPHLETSIQIADVLRVPMQAVSKVLSRSYVHDHGYVRRLKKAPGSRFYRYRLTKKGRRAYAEYLVRISAVCLLTFMIRTLSGCHTSWG
jgi:DNA-binding MarR family transcriptional regulator